MAGTDKDGRTGFWDILFGGTATRKRPATPPYVCEDGSDQGIDPSDYGSEAEYEEVLEDGE